MYINSLSVLNFKNFSEAEINFSPKLNCFIGNNGVGKTNLLDAVYYLSFCKSFFQASDVQNVKHGEEFFVVQGSYLRNNEKEEIYCGYKQGQKKRFKRNKKDYKRLAEHIGFLPLVIISPSDQHLILGGSEERRKFIDGVISQFDRVYLDWLLRYNRTLLQRNNLLKHFLKNHVFDLETLEIYDDQLADLGTKIYNRRKRFIETFLPIFQRYYQFISQEHETVELIYKSNLHKHDLKQLLVEARKKDCAIGYTTVGIHKDDLSFNLGEYPIKKLGSQGQNKTYLVALKLAQFDFVKETNSIHPILLLDDIFDKLDGQRVEQIVKLVAENNFGQIFISDTNREHLDQIFPKVGADYKIFNIVDGVVDEIANQDGTE